MTDEPGFWHPFLFSVAEYVAAQTDVDVEDEVGLLRVDSLRVTTPLELVERVDDTGRVELACSPPTQRFETSVMPVLHRLSIRVGVDR